MTFISLQNISTYSLLESPTKIPDLIDRAVSLGYSSIALTDYNYTYGLVDFYKISQEKGIKPIFGVQLSLKGLVDYAGDYHLLLLARDDAGLANLNKISSARALKEDNVTLSELTKYLGHLEIITPANEFSELKYLFQENQNLTANYVTELQKLVPDTSRLWLGVYADPNQIPFINELKKLAQDFDVSLIAVEDVRYLNSNDQFVTKILKSIQSGIKMEEPLLVEQGQGSHFLEADKTIEARYRDLGLREAVANTAWVAEEATAKVTFGKTALPKFKQTKFPTSKEYLSYLVELGLKARFPKKVIPPDYVARAKSELDVINSMGFADYFLIVWDVISFAHSKGILIGPGRGSAAGSLIAYALRITEVDPIEYELLFERFLNPKRAQMPDIDIDIPDDRRPELLEYMYSKYGMDHVAQIITFGTFGVKQSLRDVGRTFGFSMPEQNRWANAVPRDDRLTLKEAVEKSLELRTIVNTNDITKLVYQTALKLEGLPRHDSTHAAGIVLTDSSLATIVGLQPGSAGLPVTQQAMVNVEQMGLLKIDFLGLRNLTILDDIVKELSNNLINIKLNKIPMNDKATLELFQKADTEGIFQFDNSTGIKQALREIKPTSFEDVIATNALYRPGPSENIPIFAARKNGKEPITYPDKTLQPILKKTYGIIVYQEQVMQVAQTLAGFSLAEADLLRRAISKKKGDMIEQLRKQFIAGVVQQGHSTQTGETVFSYIERFGNYGFNRSHSVAYAKIAYWLAYLKVHYPAAFYVGLLNSSLGNQDKMVNLLNTAQMRDVQLIGPQINTSKAKFAVEDGKIALGLLSVKGVPRNLVAEIIKLRTKPYQSMRDFLQRLPQKMIDEQAITKLVSVGAFDAIEKNRRQLLEGLTELIGSVEMSGSNTSLFEILEPKVVAVPDFNNSQKAELEEQMLGIGLTQNRLVQARKFGQKVGAKNVTDFSVGETGILVGQLVKAKEILTKKGEPMAFLSFSDSKNLFEVTAFPQIYVQAKQELTPNTFFLLKVKTQADRLDVNAVQFILENIRILNFKN